MRIAIVSDIHANLTALEAVIADLEGVRPDLVVQGGDVALQGAHPAEVTDRIRELGWPGVVGNTDELLWRPDLLAEREAAAPKLRRLLRVLFQVHGPATSDLLGSDRIAWLRTLPAEHRFGDLVVLHASPGDLWRAPMPDAADDELVDAYRPLDSPRVVYGHIHRTYVRELGSMTVANSGSVGLPGDGDPRASYLLLEDDAISIRRVEYDVEREIAALWQRDYPYSGWLAERLRSGRFLPLPS